MVTFQVSTILDFLFLTSGTPPYLKLCLPSISQASLSPSFVNSLCLRVLCRYFTLLNMGASTVFNSQSALVFFLSELVTPRVSLVFLNQIFISSMGLSSAPDTYSILHWTIPLECPISTSNSTYPK